MKPCPEDAKPNGDSDYWCHLRVTEEALKKIVEQNPGWTQNWFCTRPKNHEGDHHAHAKNTNNCAAVWTQEEAVIEAL